MLADVVLPGASSAEKTGTLTKVDRTVHLCERAADPPGDARADLDIFLDYARRMDFRDRDGEPLIRWDDPESRVRGVEGALARPAVRLQMKWLKSRLKETAPQALVVAE